MHEKTCDLFVFSGAAVLRDRLRCTCQMRLRVLEERLVSLAKDPASVRRDLVPAYRAGIRLDSRTFDWKRVNAAILARWSPAGLDWIKREAWRPR